MAYRSFVEEIPHHLKRSVLSTFDFRGRSTRSELFIFMFVPQFLVGLPLLLFTMLIDLDFDTSRHLSDVTKLVLFIPMIGLFVRRLHDQDRSGWWALLWVVILALAAVTPGGSPSIPGIAKLDAPWWLSAALVGGIVALWVFSLWPPTSGINRYGPDPRLDEAEAAA